MRQEHYNVLEADSVLGLIDLVHQSVDLGYKLVGGMTPIYTKIKVPFLFFFKRTVSVTKYCQTVVEIHPDQMDQPSKEDRVPARHRRFQEALQRAI